MGTVCGGVLHVCYSFEKEMIACLFGLWGRGGGVGKLFGLLTNILTLNVLYRTIPHELCRCLVKDVQGSQSFNLIHSERSDSLVFIMCLQEQMLLTSVFSKENSAISLKEWVLV